MRPSVVAGVAASVACLLGAVALWAAKDRVLDTNGIDPAVFVRDVSPGKRLCQTAPPGPEEQPVYLAVTAGGYGLPVDLALEDTTGRTLVDRGQPGSNGRVRFFVRRTLKSPKGAVCIRNNGARKVALAGERSATDAQISIYLEDPTPSSWLEEAPAAVGDVGKARAAVAGRATGWLLLLLAFAGCGLAVVVIVRAARTEARE